MPRLSGLVLCAVLAAGCGGGPPLVAVTGRVVEKGGGYVTAGDETLDVFLQPVGGGPAAPRYPLLLAADGGFTVQGPNGQKVPPGEYEVAVSSRREGDWKEKFRNRFAPGKTPLKLEVGPAPPEQKFTIDLTAGTVTAP